VPYTVMVAERPARMRPLLVLSTPPSLIEARQLTVPPVARSLRLT
jgi:hypothetical protein